MIVLGCMIEIIIASGTKSNHTDSGDFKGEKHDNEGGSCRDSLLMTSSGQRRRLEGEGN